MSFSVINRTIEGEIDLSFSIIEQFRTFQAQLRDRWNSANLWGTGDYDLVVIPSLTLPPRELHRTQGFLHYEERFLFSLLQLQNPRTQIIYITSQPLSPDIIDYYLRLIPGMPIANARDRLKLFSIRDPSAQPLTQKILNSPQIINRIRQTVRLDRAYAICYKATDLERQLSVQLGLPLLATDPDLGYLGTKSGSRQIFADCQIPYPDGSPLVHTVRDLAWEVQALKRRNPGLQRCVVKLDRGSSGDGNALLDLQGLDDRPALPDIYQRLATMGFQAEGDTWASFQDFVCDWGAIVEAFMEEARSPSVEGYINPDGSVEILSTHDQILGGPDGQCFLGAEFPAHANYRLQLQYYGQWVGERLATLGALGHYGVDFVGVQQQKKWQVQAIEINLRREGTTHPMMIMKLLTQGQYNPQDGLLYSARGQAKYYRATDYLESDRYQGLSSRDVIRAIAQHKLHFNPRTETGVVLHMMGCLPKFGKLGMTCIGNAPQQAQELYRQASEVLEQMALDEAVA